MSEKKIIKIYDIETYKNCFTFVAKEPGSKKYDTFIIFDDPKSDEDISDGEALKKYLKDKKSIFVGFNNIEFDAQVCEFIIDNPDATASEIYDFAQGLITGQVKKKSHYKLRTLQIDLYKMWSFDTAQRRTSLKWLEFSMRMPEIQDLPYHHSKVVTKNQVKDVVKYNKKDVDNTEIVFSRSGEKIELRKDLYKEYKDFTFFSKGDTSLGADTFMIDLAQEMGIDVNEIRTLRTFYDELDLKSVIWENRLKYEGRTFKDVLSFYKSKTLYPDQDGILNLEGAVSHEVDFNGIVFKYGTGGLHASISNSHIRSDEIYMILDVDVSSFYPNLSIVNGSHPKHLSLYFVKKYKALYEERKLIPKTDNRNKSKKLSLNAIFGKSNSQYSYLYDTAFSLGITINGQLQLSMLAEQFAKIGKLIQVNTDGVTLLLPRSEKEKADKIIAWWQKKTGLELETAEYSQMVIRDVNNYHAIYTNGKVKRKGMFCTYEDLVNEENFHKNPSATVIANALNSYYTGTASIEDTVNGEKNIHEFLYGFKKKSNFDFVSATVQDNGYIDLKINSDRTIRYYCSSPGSSIYKLIDTMSLTALPGSKGRTFTLAQNIKKTDVDFYPNLNKNFYIEQALEVVDSMTIIDNKNFINA